MYQIELNDFQTISCSSSLPFPHIYQYTFSSVIVFWVLCFYINGGHTICSVTSDRVSLFLLFPPKKNYLLCLLSLPLPQFKDSSFYTQTFEESLLTSFLISSNFLQISSWCYNPEGSPESCCLELFNNLVSQKNKINWKPFLAAERRSLWSGLHALAHHHHCSAPSHIPLIPHFPVLPFTCLYHPAYLDY